MKQPLLSLRNVRKAFKDQVAVDGVSFDVRPGEIFGFLGPNGAGKTTTLRMILGITQPDAGTIEYDGAPHVDRARVGYLPEERGLFEDQRVLDTLAYLGELRGMSARDARTAGGRWLEKLGLADRAKSKLQELSKGMQQKIQLAGALLHDPALAVLDEPFSGLDPLNQELFLDIVRDLRAQGTTVLFSAHQLNLVERLCDRFLLIARGLEIVGGSLDEMRRSVKGGARDTLAVELVARDPQATAESTLAYCRTALARSGHTGELRIERLGGGRLRLETDLGGDTDLGPALTAIATAYAVQRVETRPVSLHEIYLHAVRSSLGEAALAEEVIHG